MKRFCKTCKPPMNERLCRKSCKPEWKRRINKGPNDYPLHYAMKDGYKL